MLPAFLATVLFSLSVLFASRTTRALGGTLANFYRLGVSAILLAIWAHAFGKGLGGGALLVFFLSGCVGFGVGDLALYQTIPRLGPRLTILMVHCLAAPFAALTEWLWLGTRLTTAEIVSGLVILTGVAIALSPREHLHLARKTLIQGIALGLVAALGQGLGAVITRKAYALLKLNGQSMDGGTAAYQRILGGLLLAALPSLWIAAKKRSKRPCCEPRNGAADPGIREPRQTTWLWVLLNSLAGPTLGVGCYQWALENNPSGVVLPIVATTPMVVIPLAYLLEGDRPGPRSLLGGIVAVAGAVALAISR
jgi:drug/metabolite transporter (DMT)-like permease